MKGYLIALLVILGSGFSVAQTQSVKPPEANDPALLPLDSFSIDASNLRQLFGKISLNFTIPIGFETSATDEIVPIQIHFKGRTVADLLDQILNSNQNYTWKSADGVINIVPKEGHRDIVVSELLDARISKISISGGTSCRALENAVAELPEVKRVLRARRTDFRVQTPNGFYLGQAGQFHAIELSNLNLKVVLNRLIIYGPKVRYWTIGRDHEDSERLSFHLGCVF